MRLRADVSPGGRSHRKALSLLSSGLLQRHILLGAGGRPARSRDPRLSGGIAGSGRGHGDSSDRDVHRDVADAPDLARSQGDRTMRRLALLFVVTVLATAASLPQEIERLLATTPGA